MLNKNLVNEILNEALSTGGDFAEVFVENATASSLSLGDKLIEHASSFLRYGISIRIFKGLFSTIAYTNLMDRENLLKMARMAAQAIKDSKHDISFNLVDLNLENKHQVLITPDKIKDNDKVAILKDLSKHAHAYSPMLTRFDANYMDVMQNVLIANTLGTWVEDTRIRTRLGLSSVVTRGEKTESDGFNNIGGMIGFELYKNLDTKQQAESVVQSAINKLDAVNCPSGKMQVIINNEFGGVIFHEACGHGLEASSVAKKVSVFTDKIGQQVASEMVSAVDDGTIANSWGSINVDDEGVTTRRNLLIENGILKGYMVDRFNGRRMGAEPTGSCRRETYKYTPTSRMTNTFILNGKSEFKDIIANTEKGLFASKLSGGSVNPATGDFNFSVSEGFIVENGQIKQQVKGAKLIGNGPEILHKIDMVGNNLSLACGMCGSSSGSIPTTVGQPTIRVSEITVGGQE